MQTHRTGIAEALAPEGGRCAADRLRSTGVLSFGRKLPI
jgi:hypothetical protein